MPRMQSARRWLLRRQRAFGEPRTRRHYAIIYGVGLHRAMTTGAASGIDAGMPGS